MPTGRECPRHAQPSVLLCGKRQSKACLCFRPDRGAGKAGGFRGPRSIVSTGHLPGLRLTLLSLGALQVTSCCPETFPGTLWTAPLESGARPARCTQPPSGEPSGERQGFCPLRPQGHRAAVQGPPSVHSCSAQGSGVPRTQTPHPEGVGRLFGERQPGGQPGGLPFSTWSVFPGLCSPARTKQLRSSSSALTPCSGRRSGQGWLLPGGSGGSPRRLLAVTRGPCSAGFTVSVHTGRLLLVSVSLCPCVPLSMRTPVLLDEGPPGSRATSS